MIKRLNYEVIVSWSFTGAGDAVGKIPLIPVTPEEVANAAIEAAKVGASIAHIHVRDPETGKGSRDPELFKEVVDRDSGYGRESGLEAIYDYTRPKTVWLNTSPDLIEEPFVMQ